jgi:hypothetical protein
MSIDMMPICIAAGLVLSGRAARALGGTSCMVRYPSRGGRRGQSEDGGPDGSSPRRRRRYLEKLARDYEIIPLMSKLI